MHFKTILAKGIEGNFWEIPSIVFPSLITRTSIKIGFEPIQIFSSFE